MLEVGTKIKSFALPKSKTGTIVKYYTDIKGCNNEDLYDVLDENGEIHTMVVSLFDNIENENDIIKMEEEIEEKISEIINELKLEKSDDVIIQLKNSCLVQKYIVEHNDYDVNIMDEKEEISPENMVIQDLYNAIVKNRVVCTSNSLMFKKILEKVGVKVEVIGLFSKDNGEIHAANIVELDGMYYFFDSSLETTIYKQNNHLNSGNLILCCAGLGKNEYCQFYSPQVVLPDNPLDSVKQLPSNISSNRIPQVIVNDCIKHSSRVSNLK